MKRFALKNLRWGVVEEDSQYLASICTCMYMCAHTHIDTDTQTHTHIEIDTDTQTQTDTNQTHNTLRRLPKQNLHKDSSVSPKEKDQQDYFNSCEKIKLPRFTRVRTRVA